MDNKACEIVRDLLPLYVDGVCSGASREMVGEHLSQCGECRELEQKLRNTAIDTLVGAEKDGVLERHAKRERTAAWKAGAIVAGILLFPIVILALVLAAGQGEFSALPILIASMMLVASMTAVPLMSKKNKFARAVICATASIMLIEFFGCMYDGESFARSAVPTLFGLSLPFMPFALKELELPQKLAERKAATVITWDLLLFFLTIFVSSLPQRSNAAFREGMLVSALLLALIIVMIFVTKLSESSADRFTKASVVIVSIGLWISFFNSFASRFFTGVRDFFKGALDLSNWSPSYIAADLVLAVIGTSIFFAAVYVIAKIVRSIIEESM